MIIFIGPNRQRHNLRGLQRLDHTPLMKHKTYNWLFRTHRLPAATYVFTFIDRLHPRERRLASRIYRHINVAGAGFKALNDPAKSKNRLGLLRSLHAAGINDFNAYRADEAPKPVKFPVFLRHLSVSLPPVTDLIHTQADLERAIDELVRAGEPLDDLIVIEYCAEPFVQDYFAKVSAYRLGDQYMLGFFLFDHKWYVKLSDFDNVPPDFAATEAAILQENKWIDVLRNAFELADIEYGRADFSLVNNRPQIYEINFHPQAALAQYESKNPERVATANGVARRRMDALISIDQKIPAKPIPNVNDPEITAFRLRPWRNFAPQRY
ncbi:hypothetical protein [Maritalea sp. S77]|uniref:hypothetical protein n=1 Tax=Maritalea sp. S77 TaxID=3415125 RepID=UPI003C7BE631